MAEENSKLVKCALCGKDDIKDVSRGLRAHLRSVHNLTLEEYEAKIAKDVVQDTEEDDIEEVQEEETKEDNSTVTQEKMTEHIFGKSDTMQDKPLSEFLVKWNMSEKDLITLIRSFKENHRIPDTLINKNKMEKATSEVELLKDKNNVETTSLEQAELLSTKHGFKVIDVHGAIPGKRAKTWVLVKKG